MRNITCIIVDDEPLARDLLKSYVLKTPFLELKSSFSNALEALDYLQKNTVDLVFLDIQMPDLTGLELSKIIKGRCKIIFTTAFEEYAIEGYKVDAIGYLLKPFNYDEFLSSALKAQNLLSNSSSEQPKTEQEDPSKNFLFIKSEYKLIKVDFLDILYVESMKDYLKIHLKSLPKPILTLMSLSAMEKELPNNFMRIHRSYVVNINAIESIERMRVYIKGEPLPVSDSYKDVFNKRIGEYFTK